MPTMRPKFNFVFETERIEAMFRRRCEQLEIGGSAYLNALVKNDCAKGGPLTVTYSVLDGAEEDDGGCQSRLLQGGNDSEVQR